MNNTVKATKTLETRTTRPQALAIAVTLAVLLAVPAARADRVSVGLGVDNGGVSLGISVNGGAHHGYRPAPHHHHRPPVRIAPSGYWREREERVWVDGCWIGL